MAKGREQVEKAHGERPYRIVIRVGAFRIEADGPIAASRQIEALSKGTYGYVTVNGVDEAYSSGKETFSTERYAIIGPDGAAVVEGPAVLLSVQWAGTWGGSSSEEILAVIDGRPAALRNTEARWFPSARPEPSASEFAPFSLPVRELVEFQSTDVPPRGWDWDASSRVLSREG
jgi:hypothetical protein